MSKEIELTRRRILGGLTAIGAASAAAGAGTMAAFTDTEQSTDNTIRAGTMNLQTDAPGNSFGNHDVSLLDVSEAVPGDDGSGSVTLRNDPDSDVGGALDVRIADVTNGENGRTERERAAGDSTGGQGELGSNLHVRAYLSGDDGQVWLGGGDAWREASSFFPPGRHFDVNYPVDVGSTVDFVVEWRIPPDAPSTIETDSYVVDFEFDLDQAVAGSRIDGWPTFTGSKAFDAKIRYGDGQDNGATAGSAEIAVDGTQTGSHDWTLGSSEPFSFEYDGGSEATATVGGDELTASVPPTNDGKLGIVAKSAGGSDAEVSNLAVDGIPLAPGAVSSSGNGDRVNTVEVDLGDFDGGVTVTGDVTITGAPSNEVGVQIDVL